MTPIRLVRILVRLMVLTVLVGSGTYFLLYLYRWEWNRAQISGLIFVATELAVVSSVLMRRLQRIEHRLAEHPPTAPLPTSDPTVAPPRPEPGGDGSGLPEFRWLVSDRTSVFIPVLLGAGAVLAALAYVVERLAAFVVGDHDLSDERLRHLRYPDAGLRGSAPVAAPAGAPPSTQPRRAGRLAVNSLAIVLGIVLFGLGISVLADYTQSRPSAQLRGSTELTVTVGYRQGDDATVEETVVALFESCRLRLPERSKVTAGPDLVAPRTAVVVVSPALGDLGLRRLEGCLEDATLDGVKAHLDEVRLVD